MSTKISVSNRLLIIGNRVAVPGFEPLSEQTTNNLSLALQGASTFLPLETVKKLIPEAKVVVMHNGGPTSGSFGFDKYLELPNGPPPNYECPVNCIRDYYKILRDHARSSINKLEDTISDECDQLSGFGGCDFNDIEKGLV